jgi:aminobutyraldehyde dehydrogenase
LKHLADDQRGHFIDGTFVPSAGAQRAVVLNPATGEPLLEAADGDSSDVNRAVDAARRALPAWRRTTPQYRAAKLLELASLIEQNCEHLARLESLNVGKPLEVSRAEIPLAVDALQFFAGAARTAQAPAAGEYVEGQLSIIRREALGVIGAITPWNYPLMMAIWKIAPALAAGNTIVLKPSELTPITTLRFAALASSVLPPGVLNVVLGTGPNVGAALTAHPDIAMVALTGSVRSGKAVASGAADTLKRVHLELGGKAPVIVFPDADLDAVADCVKIAGFWNTGQECGAATRLLVHESVHDELVSRLVPAVQSLAVGDPCEGDHVDIGPLISQRQRDNVAGFVERAIDDGAQVLCGGGIPSRPGWYFEPTVLGGIKEGSEIDQEEVFGPVVTVRTFSDEADAVRMANSVRYGLSASVWTNDSARGLRMSAELDFGTVWINSHLTLASEMPWNGFGASGYGRDMSTYALDDYTRTKHVMVGVNS